MRICLLTNQDLDADPFPEDDWPCDPRPFLPEATWHVATLEDNEPARRAFRPDAWNRLRVIARGDTIRTWLNGVPAARLVDSMTPSGFIGLQVHGVGDRADPLEVRWRDIRVRVLE